MSEERFEILRFLEAVLFAAAEPMTEKALAQRLPDDADLTDLLEELKGHYANRGVVLMQFDDRWAFRTSPDLSHRMSIERKVVRKLTRAAIETLAIIAYHQPVTRAEIEEIRGVAISKGTLDSLLEADWIKPKGRRETPGRPVTWGTTTAFLEHFSLESCEALPGVEELRAAGLLDARSAISTLGTQGGAAGHILRADGTEEDEEAAAIELRGEPNLELGEGEPSTGAVPEAEAIADDDYEAELLARVEEEALAEPFAPAEEDAGPGDDEDGDEDDDDDDEGAGKEGDDENDDEDDDDDESGNEEDPEGGTEGESDDDQRAGRVAGNS